MLQNGEKQKAKNALQRNNNSIRNTLIKYTLNAKLHVLNHTQNRKSFYTHH